MRQRAVESAEVMVGNIREAVSLYMDTCPNSHGGETSRREDMRSCFRRMRSGVGHGVELSTAVSNIHRDACSMEDM